MRLGSRRFWWRVLLVVLSALAACFVAAVILFRWLTTQPLCDGQFSQSPDGAYEASVFTCSDAPFFYGEIKHYFEFRVRGPGVDHFLTSRPIPGPCFASRCEKSAIVWDKQPAAVRFVFPSAELRFETRPNIDRFEEQP
jgi:hypothetical protein